MIDLPKPPVLNSTTTQEPYFEPVKSEFEPEFYETINPVETTKKPKKPKKSKKSKLMFIISLVLLVIGAGVVGYYGYQTLVVEPQSAVESTQKVLQLQKKYESITTPNQIEDTETETDIPIPSRVETYEDFGIIYIPAFGPDYNGLITAGDDSSEISGGPAGINYYPDAAMPAEPGNFTLAGHRGYSGAGRFDNISSLNQGDSIYIETAEGWYKYSVTGKEVVKAEQTEVLLPVPHQPGVEPTKNIITLTSCYWENNIKKRIVVYGDFIDFTPRSENKPSELQN